MQFMKSAAVAVLIGLAAVGAAEARGGGHGGGHSSYGGSHSSYGHASSHVSSSVHYTHGYTRRNGTHVNGYHATNPNHTRNDNFSTRGNVNPYTGEAGTKPRDGEH